MILISGLTAVFFFGGWLSPFDGFLATDAAIRAVVSVRSSATASTGSA